MEHLHIALFSKKEQAGRKLEEEGNCGFLVHIVRMSDGHHMEESTHFGAPTKSRQFSERIVL
jgi:hypothetical protein